MLSYISDINCPHCGSIETMIIGTDELEFYPDGTGIYSPDVQCLNCKKGFRMDYKFDYDIIEESVR